MKIPLLVATLSLSLATAFCQDRTQLLQAAEKLAADSNYGKAINLYNKQLMADSTDYEVYERRGDLYVDMKDYQQAFKDYTYSIHYNSHYCRAWAQRAALLAKLEYLDKALDDYNAALLLAGDNKDLKLMIFVNRGDVKRRMNQMEEAVSDFRRAFQLDSTNLGILADLGASLSHVNQKEEAIHYLEKAIAIDPTFEGGIGNLAFLYGELGNYAKSIELDNQLLRLKPNEPFALNNRGYAKIQSGDLEGALEDINNSILQMPYNSYAFRNRALLYLKRQKRSEACSDLQKALDLGFTKDYGDEVEQLMKKNCQPDTKLNKM
jgi:tetratricopeptide (TPR) repeat protein